MIEYSYVLSLPTPIKGVFSLGLARWSSDTLSRAGLWSGRVGQMLLSPATQDPGTTQG